MPPKSARKSTSGPGRKGTRRLVRPAEVNGEKLKLDDEMKDEKLPYEETVSPKDATASTPEKSSVEVRSDSKKEAMNETNKEERHSEKFNSTDNGYSEDSKEKERKAETDDEKEEHKEEQLDLEEEYEPEEDSTAVDYEPEELHDSEVLMEEEIEVDEGEEHELSEGEEEEVELIEDEIRDDELDDGNASEPEDDEEEDDRKAQREVLKEHRKRKEFEVFVGGLDKDATESDIRKVFSEAGELKEVRLLTNPITKKNKGFAFLRFATVDQARRVVSEFKNPLICGRRCGLAPSHDNDTLFVGNICKTWTKEHLKETLKGFGVENFEDLKLVEDPRNEGMNRGFAFLEFSSRNEAMDALKRLQKRDVKLGSDRAPKVAFSDSFRELDEEIMAQVTTLFIDHLPPAWDEDKIRKYLRHYGSIEKIELARNMPGAKRRDFGFVTFDTHDNALACVDGINDVELTDGDKKVKLRARLSRPTKKESRPRRSSSSMSMLHMNPRVRPMLSRMDRVRLAPRALPPPPRRIPLRPTRPMGMRAPFRVAPLPSSSSSRVIRRVVSSGRDRRPLVTVSERPRVRPLPPPPPPRPRHERLPPPPPLPPVRRPAPVHPKSSLKRERERDRERDYSRHELPPPPPPPPRRERAPDYPSSRVLPSRRPSYEDDYRAPPPSSYADMAPRGSSRGGSERRPYLDDDYRKHEERPVERGPPARGGRDYDSVYGSKRPYSDIDDAPRNGDAGRNSRTRLDYAPGSTSNHYADSYSDRLGRGPTGYGAGSGSSRTAMSGSLYGGRNQGLSYPGGSARGNDVGGMYSSGLAGEYLSRGSDASGNSYPSFYPSRGLGGAGSGSYY
ncbi:RNA-binding (RRM/RBD/RNP motifs) family protein isoform X1 [Carex rostrata]